AYYVLPIAKLLYGDGGTLPVASIVIMDAILVFGCTMIALEARKGRDAGAGLVLVAGRIAKLPLIWALVLGLVVSAGSLALPAPIDTFTAFVGNAASPIALFAMGVILSATPFKPEPVVFAVSTIKVVIFPATIAFLLYTLLPPAETLPLFVLASAGPSGVMAFSLALLYSVRTDAIMQVTVWTSVLTLATLAFLA
ncbi:MAG: AEC family transporter, partial [Boseongicola sp.]|nr:AEC family transporter [Boseongicola sp.]